MMFISSGEEHGIRRSPISPNDSLTVTASQDRICFAEANGKQLTYLRPEQDSAAYIVRNLISNH